MADWRKEAKSSPDWRAEAEGGAEGGAEGPSKPLIRPEPTREESPTDKAMRERYRVLSNKVDMSRGGALSNMAPDDREFYENYRTQQGLGRGIALARGVPLTGSHIDELSALLQTGKTEGADYTKKRDAARQAVNQSVAENPTLPTLASLAFAPALPPTAAGRLALSTASGASEDMGAAPNMAEGIPAAKKGGLVGFGTGLLGEAMIQSGKGLDAAKAGAIEKNRAITDDMLDKAFGSARGKMGGEVSSGSNLIQSAERASVDESLPGELRQRAKEWLESPKAMALKERVARSNLGRGEDALARIDSAQDAMHEAAANLTPEARAAAAQARIDDPSRLLRRVREVGPKIVLPAVGGWLAGPEGAAAGALTSAVLGRSGTTIRNMMADPYVASRLGPLAGTLEGAGALTQSAAPIASRAANDKLAPWSRFLKKDDDE